MMEANLPLGRFIPGKINTPSCQLLKFPPLQSISSSRAAREITLPCGRCFPAQISPIAPTIGLGNVRNSVAQVIITVNWHQHRSG
jgi:hypothetical protein